MDKPEHSYTGTEKESRSFQVLPIERHSLQWKLVDSDNDGIVTARDIAILVLQMELDEHSYLKLEDKTINHIANNIAYSTSSVLAFYFPEFARNADIDIQIPIKEIGTDGTNYPEWFNPEFIFRAVEAGFHGSKSDTSIDALENSLPKIFRPVSSYFYDRKLEITPSISNAINTGLEEAIYQRDTKKHEFKFELPFAALAHAVLKGIKHSDDEVTPKKAFSQELWRICSSLLPRSIKPFVFEITLDEESKEDARFRISLDTEMMDRELVKEASESLKTAFSEHQKCRYFEEDESFGIAASNLKDLDGGIRNVMGLMIEMCPELLAEKKRADKAISQKSAGGHSK